MLLPVEEVVVGMQLILSQLLLCTTVGYPGPHRGYMGMPNAERIILFERNDYSWPPEVASAGWPPHQATER